MKIVGMSLYYEGQLYFLGQLTFFCFFTSIYSNKNCHQFKYLLTRSLSQLRKMITTQRMGLHQMNGELRVEVIHREYPSSQSLLWKSLPLFAQSQDIHQEKQISIYRLIST